MNKQIIFQAILGGCVGALIGSGLYSVTDASMYQGQSGWLPGVLAIAGTFFVLCFLLFLLEFTFWGSLKSAKGRTRPLP
jgi:hypothetical protein